MIYFTLPNFYYYKQINERLVSLFLKNSKFFIWDQNEIKFIAQEGNLPFHYWNGSINNNIGFANYYSMNNLTSDFGFLPIIFDISNPLLVDKDFNDNAENILLSLNNNGSNSCLISNPKVRNIILQKYPYFKFIGSKFYLMHQDANITDLERIRFDFNAPDFPNFIPKNKIELNLYDSCINCDLIQNCYLKEWENIYNYKFHSEFRECEKVNGLYCNIEQIIAFKKLGIKYFYFDTKHLPLDNGVSLIPMYLDTFIKPEYRDTVDLILRGIKQ